MVTKMNKNPHELLKLAQNIRALFNSLVNKGDNYSQVMEVKDKYFSQVGEEYNFEGKVFQLGEEKAQAMFNELKALDA